MSRTDVDAEQHTITGPVAAERDHWLDHWGRPVAPLPVDDDEGPDDEASAQDVVVSLSEADTEALLTRVPGAYRTRIDDALLTALTLVLGRWAAEATPEATSFRTRMDLEGHGRDTARFPVILEIDRSSGPGEALRAVEEQLGLLRRLGPDPAVREALARLPRAEVVFEYLGETDCAALESSGPNRSPRASRAHLLEVTAGVRGGRLSARWTYGANRHRRSTMELLAETWLDALRAIVDHCR
jgi:non-ribosomal peptide synthase protein (TIGR01720 family)